MAYIGRPPEYGGFEKQDLTANGSTTTFTLNYSVSSESSLFVSVAGVLQLPGTAYTLSGGGTQIIFSAAPANGSAVFVIFLGLAYDAGTLLGTGAITGQVDLGTSPAAADQFLMYDADASSLKKVSYSDLESDTANMPANTVKVRDANSTGVPSNKAVADTQILIGDGTGFTAAALSGDVTMANTGAVAIAAGVVVNADINASAAIDATKIADGSVTSTEFQYINSLSSNAQTQISGKAVLTGSTNNTIATVTGANAITGEANFTYDGNLLDIKNAGTASSIKLYCESSNAHYQEIKAAPHAGSSSWTLTLPATNGNASQFLQTNGSGVTTWAGAGDAFVGTAQEWTAQQNFNNTALSFDATQDWALTANQVTTLTLTANTIFDAPTQMVDGAFYSILIIQDGTGGWTCSFPAATFKWAAGTAPTLTTTAAAKDLLVFRSNGTLMYEVGRQLNLS